MTHTVVICISQVTPYQLHPIFVTDDRSSRTGAVMQKSTIELSEDASALLDLGVALGQNQAFSLVAGRCSAAQAATLLRLRQETKLSRSAPPTGARRHLHRTAPIDQPCFSTRVCHSGRADPWSAWVPLDPPSPRSKEISSGTNLSRPIKKAARFRAAYLNYRVFAASSYQKNFMRTWI